VQIAQTTTDKIVIKTADTRALKMECCTRREERVDHANYARLPDFANTCVVIGDVCDDCGLGAFEAIFSGAPLDLDKEGEARTECLDILGIVCPVIYDFDDATYNAHLEFVLKYKVSYLLDWLLRFKPKGIAKMSNTEIVNHISCRDDTYHLLPGRHLPLSTQTGGKFLRVHEGFRKVHVPTGVTKNFRASSDR